MNTTKMKLTPQGFKELYVPNDWEITPLYDVRDKTDRYSFTGGPFGSDLKASDYTLSGIRVIQLQNIGDGKFLNKHKIYTSEVKANELNTSNIFPGDIIIAKMADPLARAAIIPDFEKRFVMGSDGIRLNVNKDKFDNKYIFYYINSKKFRKEAIRKGNGSTRLRIGLSDLKTIPVAHPDILEQKKIANIISTWDKAIELKQQLIDLKKEQKKGLMQKLLTGEVLLDGSKVDIEEFKIKDICKIGRGRVISKKEMKEKKGGYPVYSSQTYNKGEIGSLNTYDFDGEYITWTTDGAYAGTVFHRNGKFNCTNVCGVLEVTKENIDPRYLALVLADNTQKYVVKHGNPKLMNNIMGIIQVKIIKDYKYQQRICDFFDYIDNYLESLEKELEYLKEQKKGLMQQLLTGKTRVKV